MERYTLQRLSKVIHAPSDTIYKWIVRNHVPYTLNDYGQVTVTLWDMRNYKPRVNRRWYGKLGFQGIDVPLRPKPPRPKKNNTLSQLPETEDTPLSGLTARRD